MTQPRHFTEDDMKHLTALVETITDYTDGVIAQGNYGRSTVQTLLLIRLANVLAATDAAATADFLRAMARRAEGDSTAPDRMAEAVNRIIRASALKAAYPAGSA